MGFTFYWEQCTANQAQMRTLFQGLMTHLGPNSYVGMKKTDRIIIKGKTDMETCETMVIDRKESGFNFCKTQRLPYSEDVAKALILMYEYGFLDDKCNPCMSDDSGGRYLMAALEAIEKKQPLANYEVIRKILEQTLKDQETDCEDDE